MKEIIIKNPTGLHARPASQLVMQCKGFESEITLIRGDQTANAKSIMSIMAMAIMGGDKIQVTAEGPDAEAAIEAIATFLESLEE
ncbi:MAG: HPr family phosphocarrier protein [Clostridia bacterium]|nr:HPr family phosphocarrier protein [Clostridia bacterium]